MTDKQERSKSNGSQTLESGIDSSLSLLDEATPQYPFLPPELEEISKIASDPERDIVERLEAYEDIFESEVGDTTLTRARNIEREVGLRQIYLKFEGGNPTGTQKDRIAFAQAMDALRRGFDAITVATCGNFGAAITLAAKTAGLRCLIFIPENYHTKRIKEMSEHGAEIECIPGNYEDAVFFSQEYAQKHEIYDANPGGANVALQLRAYGEIAFEIYDELRDAPAGVAVPVSNGTTLAGIFKGFMSLYRRGKTSRMPKMIAGSSHGKNPIINAFLKGMNQCEDLRPEKIKGTAINEPLVNWHAIDGDLALSAVRSTLGWAMYASDKLMGVYAKKVRDVQGISVLPASTAGLVALVKGIQQYALPPDRYVVILTGRKS